MEYPTSERIAARPGTFRGRSGGGVDPSDRGPGGLRGSGSIRRRRGATGNGPRLRWTGSGQIRPGCLRLGLGHGGVGQERRSRETRSGPTRRGSEEIRKGDGPTWSGLRRPEQLSERPARSSARADAVPVRPDRLGRDLSIGWVSENAVHPALEALVPGVPGDRPDMAGFVMGSADVRTHRPGSVSGETRIDAGWELSGTPSAGSGPRRSRLHFRTGCPDPGRAGRRTRVASIHPDPSVPAPSSSGSRRGEPAVRREAETFRLSSPKAGTALDKVKFGQDPIGTALESAISVPLDPARADPSKLP